MSDDLPFKKEEIEAALEEYGKQNGLMKINKIEPPKYLVINVSELRKYTPDQLSEAYFELVQYAMYIQTIINKERSWERWATAKLDELASGYIHDTDPSLGWNGRMMCSKNNPLVCKKINQFLREVRMKIDLLYDVPNNIRALAETIKDLKFAALRKEKEYANGNQE